MRSKKKPNIAHNRKSLIVTLVFCYGLALVFGMNLWLPDKTFSEAENRMLASMPSFSVSDLMNGTFTKDVEEYITDQFMGRDQWIGIKWFSDLALGRKESNDIYIGKDRSHETVLIPKLADVNQARVDQNITAINRLSEDFEGKVYFTLIPTSAEMWKEMLPYGAPNPSQYLLIKSIYEEVDEDVRCIDSYKTLYENRKEDIFYRTDHHWTTLGAYYDYQCIMWAMEMVPRMRISMTSGNYGEPAGITTPMETVSTSFFGTSQAKSGARLVKPDSIDIWTNDKVEVYADKDGKGLLPAKMYEFGQQIHKDQYKIFFGGNQPLIVIKNKENLNGKKVLIIKDSYANCQLPMISENFEEVHAIDLRFLKEKVSDYARENQIDSILVLYGLSNFLTDPNIVVLN